jgi:hypothetical protein
MVTKEQIKTLEDLMRDRAARHCFDDDIEEVVDRWLQRIVDNCGFDIDENMPQEHYNALIKEMIKQ